ncbi:OprB family porin [Nitrospirillum amazonense]|uniref:OprB family porin n=1 Tax=Nitrospirillum amazonense TaxID=28077 RepID=A0A560FT60_9PROT|nr:carbohydrate porin [Nitrospirillum amazonense]TWB24828.1 OprB family porin [Nitrospirillum amazonense]
MRKEGHALFRTTLALALAAVPVFSVPAWGQQAADQPGSLQAPATQPTSTQPVSPQPAGAQPGADGPADAPGPDAPPGFWDRDGLTGNWGGLRGRLADNGLSLNLVYVGEVFGLTQGGVKRDTVGDGRFEATVELDAQTAFDWHGLLFHATAYGIHGHGLSRCCLQNIATVSNIEALPGARLFTLWAQQTLWDGQVSVRVGQLAADDEFVTSRGAALFVNGTFGWQAITGADLPGGGPAYPLATPGARVQVSATPELTVLGAVFSGNPAGSAIGEAQAQDPSGTTFSFSGDVFTIVEAQYQPAVDEGGPWGAGGQAPLFKLGAWFHGGPFSDEHHAVGGQTLADPSSGGVPATRWNDWGVYGVADVPLWHAGDKPDGGLAAFLRLAGAPADRNLIAFYADGGLTWKGPLPTRSDDTAGLAVAYAQIGSAAAGLDQDYRHYGRPYYPVRDHELLVELSYQAVVAGWATLQPNVQYVVHPGGNVLVPGRTTPVGDGLVLGLRTSVRL